MVNRLCYNYDYCSILLKRFFWTTNDGWTAAKKSEMAEVKMRAVCMVNDGVKRVMISTASAAFYYSARPHPWLHRTEWFPREDNQHASVPTPQADQAV